MTDGGQRYARVAKGTITATATVDQDVDGLTAKLAAEGKIAFAWHRSLPHAFSV